MEGSCCSDLLLFNWCTFDGSRLEILQDCVSPIRLVDPCQCVDEIDGLLCQCLNCGVKAFLRQLVNSGVLISQYFVDLQLFKLIL